MDFTNGDGVAGTVNLMPVVDEDAVVLDGVDIEGYVFALGEGLADTVLEWCKRVYILQIGVNNIVF